MLRHALSSFGESYRYILKDKISLLLAIIPVFIGILLYYFAGVSLFSFFFESGQVYIQDYLGEGTLGKVAEWIVKIVLTIILYYVVNLTFVLIVSVIASPFNDALSARIEKQVKREELPAFDDILQKGLKKFFFTIGTEIKKIVFILVLSAVILLLGFFPILTPLCLVLGAMVLSMEFIDFSWSRHDMSFKSCLSEFRKHILSYTFGGLIFIFIISVPIINLLVPSLGTSYFTILWVKNNEHRSKVTQ